MGSKPQFHWSPGSPIGASHGFSYRHLTSMVIHPRHGAFFCTYVGGGFQGSNSQM